MGNCVAARVEHNVAYEQRIDMQRAKEPEYSTFVSTLGRSLFGHVQLRRLVQNPSVLCAVKTSYLALVPKNGMESPDREVAWLRKLHHPNIVSMVQAEIHDDRVVVYTEFCRNGDSWQFCGCAAPDLCKKWIRQIASALAYMHAQGIGHCDVSVENILIDVDHNALLSDFGMAHYVPPGGRAFQTAFGKHAYMDPDFVRTGLQHQLSDVYALGVVALGLFAGRHVWTQYSGDSPWCTKIYEQGDWSDVDNSLLLRPLDPDTIAFLKKLICPRHARRTAAEILHDPFLQTEK